MSKKGTRKTIFLIGWAVVVLLILGFVSEVGKYAEAIEVLTSVNG